MSKIRDGGNWSADVTAHSDALDSVEHSTRRKSSPFRSAMSMLVFYINRAGKNLPAAQKRRLEAVKDELRRAFGRPVQS